MILRFYHGWGFDADFWRDVAALLPGRKFEYCDRGYFGEPASPPMNGEPRLAVAHSFGTMLALQEPMFACRGLIAINGFDCFTARHDLPATPLRLLDKMLEKFEKEPGVVLSDFRRRCGDETPYTGLVACPLRDDLIALRDWDCRDQTRTLGLSVLSLQGAADPILSPSIRHLALGSARRLECEEIAGAGHLLPLTYPGLCAERIANFVERLK